MNETMMATCPNCQRQFEISSTYAGQQGRCPQCQSVFMIGGGGHAPSAAPPQQQDPPQQQFPPQQQDPPQQQFPPQQVPDGGQPYPSAPGQGPSQQPSTVLAVVSLVTGILSIPFSFCCVLISLPLGITAIITGSFALKKGAGKGMAIAGLITGIVGLVIFIAVLIINIILISS